MIWPDAPTCHRGDWHADQYLERKPGSEQWRPPRPPEDGRLDRGAPARSCWYCGSIPCEDLYEALLAGTTGQIEWADMKYGWPHKLYLEIANPHAGAPMIIESRWDGEQRTLGAPVPAPDFERVKFYARHIADLTDDDTRETFCRRLFDETGVLFTLNASDGTLHWSRR